jgi:hypothetical protein
VLEALVAVPDELAARVVDESGSSDAVTVDLGEELSRAADRAFLFQLPDGPASAPAPRAISRRTGIEVAAAADLLGTLRAVVAAVLGGVPRPAFRNPGWILHPDLLDRVSRIRTIDGLAESPANEARSLASFCLFRLVSADEGMLFGFPFATSAEATNAAGVPRLYFGADWQEAWVAVDPSFITVDIPGAPSVPNATVIRASMSVDFALRRETAFAWADPPPP